MTFSQNWLLLLAEPVRKWLTLRDHSAWSQPGTIRLEAMDCGRMAISLPLIIRKSLFLESSQTFQPIFSWYHLNVSRTGCCEKVSC